MCLWKATYSSPRRFYSELVVSSVDWNDRSGPLLTPQCDSDSPLTGKMVSTTMYRYCGLIYVYYFLIAVLKLSEFLISLISNGS